MGEAIALRGPDAEKGVAIDQLPDGIPFAAQFRGEPIVLVRRASKSGTISALLPPKQCYACAGGTRRKYRRLRDKVVAASLASTWRG